MAVKCFTTSALVSGFTPPLTVAMSNPVDILASSRRLLSSSIDLSSKTKWQVSSRNETGCILAYNQRLSGLLTFTKTFIPEILSGRKSSAIPLGLRHIIEANTEANKGLVENTASVSVNAINEENNNYVGFSKLKLGVTVGYR
jgi:hypothetical protein